MVDQQDQATRRRRVEQAAHSGKMEGLELSEDARSAAESYIDGEIDSGELVATMRERYGHG